MELKEALKITFDRKGREILKNPNVLKGYLMDIAPEQAKVISILFQASANHLFDEVAICEEKDLSMCLNHAFMRMYESYAKKPADIIKDALTDTLLPDQPKPEEKPQKKDSGKIPASEKKSSSKNVASRIAKPNQFRLVEDSAALQVSQTKLPALLFAAGTAMYMSAVMILTKFWGMSVNSIAATNWITWGLEFLVAILIYKEKHIAGILLYIVSLLFPYAIMAFGGGDLAITGWISFFLYVAALLCLFLLAVNYTDKWYLPVVIYGLGVAIQIFDELKSFYLYLGIEMYTIMVCLGDLLYLAFMYFYGRKLSNK